MKRHNTFKTPKGIGKHLYVISQITGFVWEVMEMSIKSIRDFYWLKAGIQVFELS